MLAVGRVARFDGAARIRPVLVAPAGQPGEVAARRLVLSAVYGDGLSRQVLGLAAHEEDGQVGQLGHAAVAAHGVVGAHMLAALRVQPRAHAFGGEQARRDGVEAYAPVAPFHGQRLRHGMHARLGHGRRHGEGRAVPDPGGEDGQHAGLAALGQPAAAALQREVEAAAHDDVGHGVEGAHGQVLGAADEVAGRVVDQARERAAVGPDGLDHLLHGLGLAHVAGMAHGPAAVLLHQLLRCLLDHGAAPAAQVDVGAHHEKGLGHDTAQAGAAASDEDAFALEQAGLVDEVVEGHGCCLLCCRGRDRGTVATLGAARGSERQSAREITSFMISLVPP